MDSKNKNLTPELKAIYERVMNTPVKPGGVTAQSQTPSPSSPATTANPAQSLPPSSQFTSIKPQPVIGDDKPFVFSADGKKAPVKPIGTVPIDKTKAAPVEKPGGKKISMPMLVSGGVTFLALYIVVWLKVFNFF